MQINSRFIFFSFSRLICRKT